MAKSKKAKAPKAVKAENALRRITLHAMFGKVEKDEKHSGVVYGIAKKTVAKDTPFGIAHGIKGSFEVIGDDGKVMTAKQAYLGSEIQDAIATKLNGANEAVKFGVSIERMDGKVAHAFFVEPGSVDVLESLREAAQTA